MVDGVPAEGPITSEEAGRARIFGRFTPLTLDGILEAMRQNDRFWVVTDCKDDNEGMCRYIAENAPDLRDRFVIQIYKEAEYDAIHEMGFGNIIFTLYRAPEEEQVPKELIRFARKHELAGITFWSYKADDEEFFKPLRKGLKGMPLMVHTVNDPSEISRYYSMGVDAVYTDIP